jgi:hypothetical protein
MDPTANYQQYECPEEFQERLNEVGGLNRYDEPNFKLVWGQGGCPDALFRAGGVWAPEGLPSFKGYRDLLIGGGTPSWCLLQWQDPIVYGTPELYYVQNYDPDTGLQTLGEYPYHGRYRLLYNLRWMERQPNGTIRFEAMPLNSFLINTIVPIIMAAREISHVQVMAAMRDLHEVEEKNNLSRIEDVIRDRALPFKGAPVSYQRQGCRTSLVDKKIEQMLRYMNKMSYRASSLGGNKGRGLVQMDRVPQ